MTGSTSDAARRVAAIGAVLLLIAGAPAVSAQTAGDLGRPVPLVPPPQAAPAPPPIDAGDPAVPAAPTAPVAPAAPDSAGSATINVESLGAFDRAAVGLLEAAGGGLGEGLWNGTGEQLVAALLPGLPMASPSPVQQDLARRLLLTTATAPARESGTAPADLFAIRLQRLFAGGRLEDVVALAERGALRPESAAEPAARAVVQARLLLGDEAPACAAADARLAVSQEPYWQQLQTYCRAKTGDRTRVDFNAELLRELGIDDAAFFRLLPAVMGSKAKLESLPAPSPLHLAMLRHAGMAPPDDLLERVSPPSWRAVAAMPAAADAQRLAAAEQAARVGSLAPEALAGLYRSVSLPAEQHADAERVARNRPGPLANALLFQAVHAEAEPEARARLARLALALAEPQGLYLQLARVYAPVLRELRPTGALAGYALDAGRALVAAGDVASAVAWFRTAHIAAGNREPQAVGAVLELWPLLVVADETGEVGYSEETLDTWWQVREEEADQDRFARATALLTALAAAGRPVDETALWRTVLGAATPAGGRGASPLVLTALAQAGEAVRTGETVLLALLALGEGGPAEADLRTIADVVRALRRVGLVGEGRRVLLEALLARGF